MSLKTVVRLKLHKDRKNIKNSESSLLFTDYQYYPLMIIRNHT